MGKNVLLVLITALLGSSACGLRSSRRQQDGDDGRGRTRTLESMAMGSGSVIDVSLSSNSASTSNPAASSEYDHTPTSPSDYSSTITLSESGSEIETGGPFIGPQVFIEPRTKPYSEGKGHAKSHTADLVGGTKRIIGGFDAEPHPFHTMLLLQYGGGWRWAGCGGTLVSNCHVVTAAHCAADPSKPLGAVFVNAHRPYQENEDEPFHFSSVQHVIRHAQFNATTNANDIAVIRMAQCLNTTLFPPAIPADPTMDIPSALVADILGFGKLSEQGNMFVNVQSLQRAEVPLMPQDTCAEYYGEKIKEDMFCAGFSEGGVDACQGDSGSSMTFVRDDGRAVLIGVISWGVGCGRRHSPGVYSSVEYHFDWIAKQVCEESETHAPWCSAFTDTQIDIPSSTPTIPLTLTLAQPGALPATASSPAAKTTQKGRAAGFYSTSPGVVISPHRTIADDTASSSSSTSEVASLAIENIAAAARGTASSEIVAFWGHGGCKAAGLQCWLGGECCSGLCRQSSDSQSNDPATTCVSASPFTDPRKRTRGVRAKNGGGK